MKGGCKRTLKSDMVLLDRFCFTVFSRSWKTAVVKFSDIIERASDNS